ncbi:hypothetical protein AB4084_19540, partial [Lysobacter sp. 2RAB21]
MQRRAHRWRIAALALLLALIAPGGAVEPAQMDSAAADAATRGSPDTPAQVEADSQEPAQDTAPPSSGVVPAAIPDSIVPTVATPARTGPTIVPTLRARSGAPALPRVVRVAVPDWGAMPFADYNLGHSRGFSIELLEEILRPRG